jgi:hypothetical protein
VVAVAKPTCATLGGMATTKATPAKRTTKSVTPSGHGVVNPGRTGRRPRSNDDVKNRDVAARSPVPKGWWEKVTDHRGDPMVISAGLHRLADTIYRPDVAPDADRPLRRSRVPDERLYGNGRTESEKPRTARSAKTKPQASAATKTTSKTRSR